MGRKRKKYEELTILDDFMFGKVMRNPKHCKKLLEIILDVKIRKIAFIDDQQTADPDYAAKGIRIDVYVEDNADTVYTLEMQLRNTGELPMRSRYYQSVIDINMLQKGLDYKLLKKSYVIFICTFDLFGRGLPVYHFENLCREDPSVRLEDGAENIFLNTKGSRKDIDAELRGLLDYFESLVPQDTFTGELEEAVIAARLHREWRQEYMKLEMMMRDSREEGKTAGRKEGRKEGRTERTIELVCRKLAKGKKIETIAEELEEDLDEIRHLCDIAAKYAPDFDTEKILKELLRDA